MKTNKSTKFKGKIMKTPNSLDANTFIGAVHLILNALEKRPIEQQNKEYVVYWCAIILMVMQTTVGFCERAYEIEIDDDDRNALFSSRLAEMSLGFVTGSVFEDSLPGSVEIEYIKQRLQIM